MDFVQKNTSKLPNLVYANLSYLTLEGPGRQTVDTRSTMNMAKCTSSWESAAGAAEECQCQFSKMFVFKKERTYLENIG